MDKSLKNYINIGQMDDPAKDAKSVIDKALEEVSKTSPTKQIIMGTSTGWIAGLLAMKIGKTAALAVGSGIILLQIAHEKGYIKINWDKILRQADEVASNVDEELTDEGSSWMNIHNNKRDKTKNIPRNEQSSSHSWFSRVTDVRSGKVDKAHHFLVSFVAGVALGIGSS